MKSSISVLLTLVLCGAFFPRASGQTRVKPIATLKASDGAADDFFGGSVAVDSSTGTIVVGAQGHNQDVGAAYVFQNNLQVAELTCSDCGDGLGFGSSVAIAGNVIAASNGAGYFVFVQPKGGWQNMTESAELTAPGTQGNRVVIAGNVILGGSSIFVKPEGGWVSTSTPDATLTLPFSFYSASSLSADGSTVAIGGYNQGNGNVQAVAVYAMPLGGWKDAGAVAPVGQLTMVAVRGCDLGASVALFDNMVIGGCPQPHGGNNTYLSGALEVFEEPEGGWSSETTTFQLRIGSQWSGGNKGAAHLGSSVAVDTGVIIAGAPQAATGPTHSCGAAFVYFEPEGGWAKVKPTYALIGNGDGCPATGSSVATSGGIYVAGAIDYGSRFKGEPGAAFVYQPDPAKRR
jgi:hypothetical protein